MKPTIERSNSYAGYRYTPVNTSVAEDSEGEGTEKTSTSKLRVLRSVSDSGMGNRYSSAPTFEDATELQKEGSATNSRGESAQTRNGSQILKHRRLIIAVLFFVVSLALHFYTLKNYMESDFETSNTQMVVHSPDSLIGLNVKSVACLLTINYTKFRREVINTSKDCTLRDDLTIDPAEKPVSINGLRTPLECLCTKQLNDTELLHKFPCEFCKVDGSFFPPCQHNGEPEGKTSKLLLSEDGCGRCNCSEVVDFTGNFCQLPKKLKCEKCDPKACLELPFCNGTSTYPCQDLHDSKMMNCTNKGDHDDVQDCLPESNTSNNKLDDQTATTTETVTKNSRAKGSDRYAVYNTTEDTQSTCSRASAIGYLVIDWIVFVGIIVQFLYVFKKCCRCRDEQNSKTIYRIIISIGLILIIIPPIVHCVTCCSGNCNTVGKLLPFIKCTFLAITTFLLYKEESVKSN